MFKVWFYPCWDLECFFHNNEQCFLYVQVQVKIWRDYAHPRQLFQMIQILLYVFSLPFRINQDLVEKWKEYNRNIYTHVRCVFFHMLRVWKMLLSESILWEKSHELTRISISISNLFRLFKSFTDLLVSFLFSIEVWKP